MSTHCARADVGKPCSLEAGPGSPQERFDDVVQRHRRSVTLAAYQITQNIDDARDVAQHVFMQLFRKQPLFNDQRSAHRWLYVVTRNEALNVRRRRQRDSTAASLTSDDVVQLGLEDTVVQNERARRVRAMIARLPNVDRNVIELRYLHSLTTTEIAQNLGVPVQRVRRDIARAKWRLRNEMLRQGVADPTA